MTSLIENSNHNWVVVIPESLKNFHLFKIQKNSRIYSMKNYGAQSLTFMGKDKCNTNEMKVLFL